MDFLYFQYLIKIISSANLQKFFFTISMSQVPPTTPVVPIPGAKPASIKIEPWTDYPRQSYTIHNDDFCHTKSFVAKFTARGTRSTLNIKETLTQKEGKYNVEDDVKLWFDLPNNHSLYTRIKSTNYIKLHYDHGICQCFNRDWNLYGSFWTDKALSKSSIRIGAAHYHPKCHSDNRVRINTSSSRHEFVWYNRTLSFYNQSKLGLIAVADLTNKVLQKNNILLGHIFANKHQVFLRLQNDGFRKQNPDFSNIKSLWDNITANYVVRADQTTRVGLEASYDINKNVLKNAEAVVEKFIPEQKVTLKVKANNKYDVAFLFKRALWGFEDLANLSVGLGVNNLISEKRRIQHGIQVDFNI